MLYGLNVIMKCYVLISFSLTTNEIHIYGTNIFNSHPSIPIYINFIHTLIPNKRFRDVFQEEYIHLRVVRRVLDGVRADSDRLQA